MTDDTRGKVLRECVMQQHGLQEMHVGVGHGSEAQALAANYAFVADDDDADQAEPSDWMIGEKRKRLTVQGQHNEHYNSMGNTCAVCCGVHDVPGCTTQSVHPCIPYINTEHSPTAQQFNCLRQPAQDWP